MSYFLSILTVSSLRVPSYLDKYQPGQCEIEGVCSVGVSRVAVLLLLLQFRLMLQAVPFVLVAGLQGLAPAATSKADLAAVESHTISLHRQEAIGSKNEMMI